MWVCLSLVSPTPTDTIGHVVTTDLVFVCLVIISVAAVLVLYLYQLVLWWVGFVFFELCLIKNQKHT